MLRTEAEVEEVLVVQVEDQQCSHLVQLQPHFTTTNVRQNVETQQMMQESV